MRQTKNIKKFQDLLFFLTAKFGNDGVVETKLMKLLYFAEANYYEKNKKTISGVKYIKNYWGPTPDFLVLKEAVKGLKQFLAIEEKSCYGKKIKIYRTKNNDYSCKSLTEQERQEAEEMFCLYHNLPSEQLSKISHLDPPYLAAEPKEKIDFKYTEYRKAEEDCEEPLSLEEQKKLGEKINKDGLAKLFEYAARIS